MNISELGVRDKVIKIKTKIVEYVACKVCGKEVTIEYCVTNSWQGWVIRCPVCGVIKEYDC